MMMTHSVKLSAWWTRWCLIELIRGLHQACNVL